MAVHHQLEQPEHQNEEAPQGKMEDHPALSKRNNDDVLNVERKRSFLFRMLSNRSNRSIKSSSNTRRKSTVSKRSSNRWNRRTATSQGEKNALTQSCTAMEEHRQHDPNNNISSSTSAIDRMRGLYVDDHIMEMGAVEIMTSSVSPTTHHPANRYPTHHALHDLDQEEGDKREDRGAGESESEDVLSSSEIIPLTKKKKRRSNPFRKSFKRSSNDFEQSEQDTSNNTSTTIAGAPLLKSILKKKRPSKDSTIIENQNDKDEIDSLRTARHFAVSLSGLLTVEQSASTEGGSDQKELKVISQQHRLSLDGLPNIQVPQEILSLDYGTDDEEEDDEDEDEDDDETSTPFLTPTPTVVKRNDLQDETNEVGSRRSSTHSGDSSCSSTSSPRVRELRERKRHLEQKVQALKLPESSLTSGKHGGSSSRNDNHIDSGSAVSAISLSVPPLPPQVQVPLLSQSSSSTAPTTKTTATMSVSFNTIQIREYERIVGDNPSVSSGVPLSIGWKHTPTQDWNIDDYEHHRRDDRRYLTSELLVSATKREYMLRDDWDESMFLIRQAAKNSAKARSKLNASQTKYFRQMASKEKWKRLQQRFGSSSTSTKTTASSSSSCTSP